jgi:hypothetical protein
MTREEFAKFLSELAQAGVKPDLLNNLGQQIVSNQNALNVVDKSVYSVNAFNQYAQGITQQVEKAVNEKLVGLASLRDNLNNIKKDSQAYKDAINDIQQMEDTLQREGYAPDVIKQLTLKTREGLNLIQTLSSTDVPNTEDIVKDIDLNINRTGSMPNNQNNQGNNNFNANEYIKRDDPQLTETMAKFALGSVGMTSELFDITSQYRNLYGKDPENISEFVKVANQNFQNQGKGYKDSAEEFFKFGERRQQIATEQFQAQIEAAKKQAESDTIKKYGIVPNRTTVGEGSKRHLTNIVSRGPETVGNQNNNSDLSNADNQLNQNRTNEEGNNQVNNQQKFNRKEFTLPINHLVGQDGLLPAERRGGGIENRGNRVQAAIEYVEKNNIDLTAD